MSRLVVNIGPVPGQPGGMASVANEFRTEYRRRSPDLDVEFWDSGAIGNNPASRLVRFMICGALIILRRPDLIHLNVATKGSTWRKYAISLTCRFARVPYGLHLHAGFYADFLSRLNSPSRNAVLRFFGRASYVTVLGDTWRVFAEESLHVPRSRIHVIPNGVADPKKLSTPSLSETIVYLGRIESKKGVDTLLDALQILLAEPRSLQLVLAGPLTSDGELARRLREMCQSHPQHIAHLGNVSRDQVVNLLEEAAIFCLPSRGEGLPMSLLEAMAAGLPSVVTDVGAVSEVVRSGVEGFYVTPGDQVQLATALDSLLKSPSARNQIGQAARQRWASHFSATKMFDEHVRVWQRSWG